MMAGKTNLLGLSRQEMEGFFISLGERPFRAAQVMKWIYHRGADDFEQMTDLGKVLRARLRESATLDLPQIAAVQPSRDGTRKWMLRLDDDNSIETVFIPADGRGTLCVSSQVGCALACSFCSTARQGFNRNLTTSEIIAQLVVAQRSLGIPPNRGERVITNVVMMGMGEPLLNLGAVTTAIELMQDDLAFGISRRRVTVSTAGVVPGIDKLREWGDVSLAVSLHATNDALRDTLVPVNRKYPIKELLAACRRYVEGRRGHRVTFEYVMLDGINDSPDDARALLRLMRSVPSKVNLIPFNPFPDSSYRTSSQRTIERFRDVLIQGGITTVTRRTRGDDIDAACGQLVGKVQDRTRRSARFIVADRQIAV